MVTRLAMALVVPFGLCMHPCIDSIPLIPRGCGLPRTSNWLVNHAVTLVSLFSLQASRSGSQKSARTAAPPMDPPTKVHCTAPPPGGGSVESSPVQAPAAAAPPSIGSSRGSTRTHGSPAATLTASGAPALHGHLGISTAAPHGPTSFSTANGAAASCFLWQR